MASAGFTPDAEAPQSAAPTKNGSRPPHSFSTSVDKRFSYIVIHSHSELFVQKEFSIHRDSTTSLCLTFTINIGLY